MAEDLDFFCSVTFNSLQLEKDVTTLGQHTNTELAPGTLNTDADGVKLQLRSKYLSANEHCMQVLM